MSSPYNAPPPPAWQPPPRSQTNGGLLAMSILATIFCCLPFGIVAIVYTAKGEDDTAKNWLIASVVVGIIAGIIFFAVRS